MNGKHLTYLHRRAPRCIKSIKEPKHYYAWRGLSEPWLRRQGKRWLIKWIHVLSKVIIFIPSCSVCQMQAKFPRVEFIRTPTKLEKLVVLCKRPPHGCMSYRISYRGRAGTAKKRTEKLDVLLESLFCSLNLPLLNKSTSWPYRCRRRRLFLPNLPDLN